MVTTLLFDKSAQLWGMLMRKIIQFLILFFSILILSLGCKSKAPVKTVSSQINLIKPGDLIVVNSTSRSLLLLDSDGNFKQVIYDVDNIAESLYGIAFKSDTNEIIFSVNGSPRVGAISVVNGTYRTLIADANLTGTLKGLTQTPSGDILVIENTNVERFSSTGVRRTLVSGVTWPNTFGAIAGPEQITSAANGEIIICGSANVKRYSATAGAQVGASVVSGIAGTTATFGCMELSNGKVAISFSGTTDTISTCTGAMTGVAALYSDIAVLGAPRTLTQTLNGNLIIPDSTFNQLVEITTSGTFVRTLGGTLLGTPTAAFSVPNY